jgi:hypothetical protein
MDSSFASTAEGTNWDSVTLSTDEGDESGFFLRQCSRWGPIWTVPLLAQPDGIKRDS